MAELLQANHLSKQFGTGNQAVRVLEGLTLTLDGGQSLALVGRSGSGKSTLLNLLCGLERPDSGALAVCGQVLEGAGAPAQKQREARWAQLRRGKLGVVFQEANLMPTLTLLENVRLRAGLAGQSPADCANWLERLGIASLAGRYPDQVSGGQRQRAALAMVFAMQPALILADEPTGSLDAATAQDVARELFRLQRQQGCGLILATHDIELAALCHRQLDLGHGAGR